MKYDIAIVGGGIVGGALACALSGQGMTIVLIDGQSFEAPTDEAWGLRVSAMTPTSRQFLEQINVWQDIPVQRMTSYNKMTVWESQPHKASSHLTFDSREMGLDTLGYIVENERIQQSIYTQMASCTDIVQLCPAQLTGLKVREQGVSLFLQDQPTVDANLIIGCDGRASKVRQLTGIDSVDVDYDEQAIVATVHTEKAHQNTAWQRFLATGPLAFLPLPDSHQVSIVWSAQKDTSERLYALSDEAFSAALDEAFENRLGRVTLNSQRAVFPLTRHHATRYINERVVLAGDAAHTVHPLAGQGLNMGLLDVALLAKILAHNHRQKKQYWSEHRLRPYERQRKSENTLMIGVCEGLRRCFLAEAEPMAYLRRIGLDFVQQCHPLKRQMIRYATHRYE